MSDRCDIPHQAPLELDRHEMRLALQRLASGYYNRPDVLREVARRILLLEDKSQP